MKKNKYGEIQLEKKDGKDAAGGAAIVGGSALAKHMYDRGHITGRETLHHATKKGNGQSILDNGLKADFASDPNNITHQFLQDVPEDKIKGKVYLGRKQMVARGVGMNHGLGNYEMLKAKVPTWKMKEVDNPELRGAKNHKEFLQKLKESGKLDVPAAMLGKTPDQYLETPVVKQLAEAQAKGAMKSLGRKGTAVIEGDVGSEYFKKSKNFKRLGADEMKDFIKNNKGRFGKGVAGAALGIGAVGLGAKMIHDNHKKFEKSAGFNECQLEKIASYKEDIYFTASIEK